MITTRNEQIKLQQPGFLKKLRRTLAGVVFILCCSLFAAHNACAQRFGNEWISKNQIYFKISLAEDGIYKLTYSDLQQAGFPVNSVDPRRIQLFFRGKEQAIRIQGQQDARLDPEDFILFYGQRNDGTLDKELYILQEAQPHPYYNLHSDTTAYFLTWRLDAANGKRMATFSENNINELPAEPYHLEEKLHLLTSNYSLGRQYPIGSYQNLRTHLSSFDYGEGWTGSRIQKGQPIDYTIPTDMPYTSGPDPHLEILLAGRNNLSHNITIQVGNSTGSLRTLSTLEFDYYDNIKLSRQITWSDISSGQLVVRITPNGVDGRTDNVSVSYIRLVYPQLTNALEQESKKFTVNANTGGKAYVEIANPPAGAVLLDVTVPDEPVQIGFNTNNSHINAIIPETTVDRNLLLGSVKQSPYIRKVNLPDIDVTANYIIIYNALLRQAGGKYSDPVKAYHNYRASASGGGFKVLSADIQQLFDQFSYGEVSPLAIRHFADYMLANGGPQYLLLMGKGLTVDHNYYRKDPSTTTIRSLVPTGGAPGSDIVFTSGLKGSDGSGPAIPTGRINARNAAEVAAYLDKVKEHESRPLQADYNASGTREALWKKHMVHLSGGVTINELNLFAWYVNQFKERAEGDFLGGQVSTLSKTTNNATELINIADEVNKGLLLVTFFGHSSTTRTDIEIGYVSNDELGYRNKGKYPAILLNGCNAGNIFTSALTFGEDWISTVDRGAINVIAHSAEGFSNILKVYSNSFYAVAFQDSSQIDQSIGRIKLKAAKHFIENYNGTETEMHIAQVQQMVLQGDPNIRLFGRDKPDFEVNDHSLFLAPVEDTPITAFSDSFAINIIVRNFGRTTRDSLAVRVNRTLNNGKVIAYDPVYYPAVQYEDTLQFIIHADENLIQQNEGFGNNRFEVIIDSGGSIPELNENNNRAAIDYFIPLGGTVNVLPYNYAIVNNPTVLLQTQPGNLKEAMLRDIPRKFLLEIDTSANFNSPVKMQLNTDATALARWQVTLPVTLDSTVYYWRTKYDQLQEGEIDSWTQSSFTFISESPGGWVQLKSEQLKQNEISQLTYENKQWQFTETSVEIDVITYGGSEQESYPQLTISGKQFLYTSVSPLVCRNNSINGVAFEREGLRPYPGIPPRGFDHLDPNSCGPLPQVINTFNNTQVTSNLILETYIDGVNAGDAVLLFSIGQLNFQSWPASTLAKLAEIGVVPADIANLQDGEPIIILGRKSAEPGSAIVIRADTAGSVPATAQAISLKEEVIGQYSSGSVLSGKIGPASSWQSLQHLIQNVESPTDEIYLKVIGETLSGSSTILYDNVAATSKVDLSDVDALQYPFLRLQLTVKDKINFTPPQLRKWLVSYTGVPEGAIFMVDKQTQTVEMQEGASGETAFGFYNMADVDFTDSVSVIYSFSNQNTRKPETDTLKFAPLAAGDTAIFHLSVKTLKRVGVNDLQVHVNPHILREQSYNNNLLTLPAYLTVKADKVHPVLDVAFDGVYIMDGDIVSPSPMITIELQDENPFLLKQDTAGIDIYLGQKENEENAAISNAGTAGSYLQRIDLSASNVSWTPATKEEPLRVMYQPEPLQDGTYTLRVQAKDASGNTSGAEPYEVNFEVINASAITNFYPYPNPFSTSTRFVFTLTGSEIPEQLKIQVMTVSGKIVREITQDEIGPVRIGNNISSYAWDGRDEFGDKLANGVYLYKVLVQANGKAVDHRETSADRAFKNGFGKLYILR